jgi:hypothetical protein
MTTSGWPTRRNKRYRPLDNTIATSMHPATTHPVVHHEHEHVVLPQHRHHFETEDQQREAGSFGMWLFLLTEIMFFGGLFFAYLLYRNWYYPAFAVASNQLSVPWGGFNTAVLITSGFCMALGVYYAEVQKRGMLVLMLVLTTFFGLVFLGVKGIEYHEKYEMHHIPGAVFGYSTVLLSLLCDDRHACPAYDHRDRIAVLADVAGASRGVQCRVCGADRKLRVVLALCRYCVAVPVSSALPDQPAPTALNLPSRPGVRKGRIRCLTMLNITMPRMW